MPAARRASIRRIASRTLPRAVGRSLQSLSHLALTGRWAVVGPKTAAYTARVDEMVKCDPSGGGFLVTLPTPSQINKQRKIWVKNVTSSTNTITVVGTIDNVTNASMTTAYGSLVLFNDGTSWWSE